MFDALWNWWDGDGPLWLIGGFLAVVGVVLAFVIVAVTYFAFTGGQNRNEKIVVDGVTCIATKSRIDGTTESVACPVIRKAQPGVRNGLD